MHALTSESSLPPGAWFGVAAVSHLIDAWPSPCAIPSFPEPPLAAVSRFFRLPLLAGACKLALVCGGLRQFALSLRSALVVATLTGLVLYAESRSQRCGGLERPCRRIPLTSRAHAVQPCSSSFSACSAFSAVLSPLCVLPSLRPCVKDFGLWALDFGPWTHTPSFVDPAQPEATL
jgi:hypothetical protein